MEQRKLIKLNFGLLEVNLQITNIAKILSRRAVCVGVEENNKMIKD